MDPLSSLLSGIRAEGSVVARAVLDAPWVIEFTDRAPLVMLTVLRGGGTLLLPGGETRVLTAGDTAVVRGPEPFRLADHPGSAVRAHTAYEISCFLPGECDSPVGVAPGSPTPVPAGEATTELVVGAYRATGNRHERLLRALPPVLVVGDESQMCGWCGEAAEVVGNQAGAQALMDRLFDWGLVHTLRTWLANAGDCAPAWYRGLADPVVGPALTAMHNRPGHRWTVAELATQAAVSRALFARRFTDLMGEPPLAYLTEWRMAEAEELLADSARSVAEVAASVGYADAFGFSAAFKRHRGQSPTAFRAATRPAPVALSG